MSGGTRASVVGWRQRGQPITVLRLCLRTYKSLISGSGIYTQSDAMPVNVGTPTNDSKRYSLSGQTQRYLEAKWSSYKTFLSF